MTTIYTVERHRCKCHPETCCCNSWNVMAGTKRVASYLWRSEADALVSLLNKGTLCTTTIPPVTNSTEDLVTCIVDRDTPPDNRNEVVDHDVRGNPITRGDVESFAAPVAERAAAPASVPEGSVLARAEIYTLRRLIECAEKLNTRPRPMCRDCADEDGTCPNSGLECDMRKLFADAKSLHNKLAAPEVAQPAAQDERAAPSESDETWGEFYQRIEGETFEMVTGAFLDGFGAEVKLERRDGETDEAYRNRIRELRERTPSGWEHTMYYERGTDVKVTGSKDNPFGVPGEDYSEEYRVESIPLYKQ